MSTKAGPILIVGSGPSGYALLRELRRRDSTSKIELLTADDGTACEHAGFAPAIAGGRRVGELVIATAVEAAERHRATIRPHTRALSIEPARRTVHVPNGEIGYRSLVLATGSEPQRPACLAGNAAGQVLFAGTLDEYRYFRHELEGRRRVVILGGTEQGCAYADALHRGGCEVLLFEPCGRLFDGRLPALASSRFARSLARSGVRVELEDGVARIDQADDGFALLTLSGRRIAAELVLCAGRRHARIALARTAGLEVGSGIRVDRSMRTSDADIFALGACAEFAGRALCHAGDIEEAARVVADRLCGGEAVFRDVPRPRRLTIEACPMVLCEPPPVAGEWVEAADVGGVEALFHDTAGGLRGYVLIGDKLGRADRLARLLQT
jgi:rubredoxin-NAD+ reductase